MATETPITHPRFGQQMRRFYPHSVDIVEVDGTSVVTGLRCRYDPARGSMPEMFENEAPAPDKCLLPRWKPAVTAKMHAVITVEGERKRFVIMDALPHASGQMLLMVSPL